MSRESEITDTSSLYLWIFQNIFSYHLTKDIMCCDNQNHNQHIKSCAQVTTILTGGYVVCAMRSLPYYRRYHKFKNVLVCCICSIDPFLGRLYCPYLGQFISLSLLWGSTCYRGRLRNGYLTTLPPVIVVDGLLI